MKTPISSIIVSKDNPRQSFDEEGLRRLGESIKEHGQLQAILVRPKGNHQYELVVGERRFRASKMVGLTEIEATVQDLDDATCMLFRLIENAQREDLTEAEKGNVIAIILDKFPEKFPTLETVATEVGKAIDTVRTWLYKSDKLSDSVKKLVGHKQLTDSVVSGLLQFDHETQDKLAQAIIKYKIKPGHERIDREFIRCYKLNPQKYPSVESLEELANEVKGIKKVKIDLDKLSPEARAEVERKLKEAEEEAKALRKKTSRTNRRRQGRPRRKKKTVIAEPKAEEEQPISEPTIQANITTVAVTINLPETLWEKLHRYMPGSSKLLGEKIVELLESHPALREL